MYNGIGLTSVRGSGTSGYVQRNLSHVSRQRKDRAKSVDKVKDFDQDFKGPKAANPEILDHNRKREVEVKVMRLRETLEESGPWPIEERRTFSSFSASLGHDVGFLWSFAAAAANFADIDTYSKAQLREKLKENNLKEPLPAGCGQKHALCQSGYCSHPAARAASSP